MQSSLKLVDCIIEVHDARIPLSGRNPLFQETLGLKPHVLVLNKMDLADLKEQQKIIQHLEGKGLKNVVFTNCVRDENIKQVIPMVRGLVESSYRYHRGESLEYCAMVIGIPNVGKSSLINALRRQHLRKGKATRVGGEPGITRAVMSRIQVGSSAAGSRAPCTRTWCFLRPEGWPAGLVLHSDARHCRPLTSDPCLMAEGKAPAQGHTVACSPRLSPACPHMPFLPWEEKTGLCCCDLFSKLSGNQSCREAESFLKRTSPLGQGVRASSEPWEPSSLAPGATQQHTGGSGWPDRPLFTGV
uniref:G domain-containing protein n=1 Tax=Ursus maritimus TaxID=29073 RepID=A0A452U031_URSMA